MHVMLRLPQFAAVLLLAAPCVGAETPFTDPIPPAVIGRPLHQMQPAKPAPPSRPRPIVTTPYGPYVAATPLPSKPIASKPAVGKRVAAKPAPAKPDATVATAARKTERAPQAPASSKAAPATPSATSSATSPASAAAAAAAPAPAPAAAPALAAAAPAAVLGNSAAPRAAKTAVDDRPDPRARPANDVGQGSRFASKPLDAGAYISSKYQALVRQYYQANPASTKGAKWKIGEPVPRKASLSGVPDDLRARLPVVPPGLQYVQVDGEVVLLAVQSRMVVDGVARATR